MGIPGVKFETRFFMPVQVRPMTDERKLQKLEAVDPRELRPEFTDGLKDFMGRLIQHALPKTLGTTVLTGAMLAGGTRPRTSQSE
jgi:hypothetical protein